MQKLQDELFEYLTMGGDNLAAKFKRSHILRDLIVKFSSQCTGSQKENSQILYQLMKFDKDDIKNLKSPLMHKKIEAIVRLRSMGIPIENENIFRQLLTNKNPIFKWAVLELLINQKKQKALPWFIWLHLQKEPPKAGVSLHLLGSLASVQPEILSFLLTYNDNEYLTQLILKTLSVYPNADAIEPATKIISAHSQDETIISAIKFLAATPGERSFEIFERFVSHRHWVVRLLIAGALRNYPSEKGIKLLEGLTLDPSFSVRKRTIESIIYLEEFAMDLFKMIKGEIDHPCHQIILSELSDRDSKTYGK